MVKWGITFNRFGEMVKIPHFEEIHANKKKTGDEIFENMKKDVINIMNPSSAPESSSASGDYHGAVPETFSNYYEANPEVSSGQSNPNIEHQIADMGDLPDSEPPNFFEDTFDMIKAASNESGRGVSVPPNDSDNEYDTYQ